MKNPLSLSIIVPVYNEELRLQKTFAALEAFYNQGLFEKMEVIFVNDGSTDKTTDIINRQQLRIPKKLISYSPNRGKGRAVAVGMLESKMDYALLCDADISTPFEEITKFIKFMDQGVDVIIGTRKSKEAQVLKPQSFIRRNMGKCYTFLADLITGLSVSDFTCGFKLFSRSARAKIFDKVKIDRWSYDTEVLYVAHKQGLKIQEVPVRWSNDENTRVRLYKDAVRSFIDILKIRFHKY